ncbi:MAG: sodium-dependent transporter, partial [Leptospiraceae bacterium]|nr:sodium-dependent transporter [Leptospiraceae bacterium]
MSNPNPKEKWASRLGLILVVASSAVGLGNFLRFPGKAVQNGGGAFMIPYVISFILLGIPVCLSEWIMGRIGGKKGHSAPHIFYNFLGNSFATKFSSTIALLVPTLIYVYYVFIEAWCFSYAIDFIFGNINFTHGMDSSNPNYTSEIVKNSGEYFITLTGANGIGEAFKSKILFATLFCFLFNFLIIYRGLSKGIEALAKIAFPILFISALIILTRVVTLEGIEKGYGYMWNPDWSKLLSGEVWVAAAGQIFFSLSVGFGIVLLFTSYLSDRDDVTLSGLTAASLNEFIEVGLGGMITIPIGFIFLGSAVASFGTFGMGFVALPSVFEMMPGGRIFGAIWFLVLFIAAITSSVTMLQPGISFLEETFHMKRRNSVFTLFAFTFLLTMGILYLNFDSTALDYTDFWVGTIFIYILATIQVIIYGWVIGPDRARKEAEKGALITLPKSFDFLIKYITPAFLII